MIGGYFYYDDDHDCMWSGDCHTCQTARISITELAAGTTAYLNSLATIDNRVEVSSTDSSPSPPVKKERKFRPPTSNQDVKKLRHREVEKNRHRQLQAMVKKLSESIPGRLDKETQVQTMKRAARYCIYLREVINDLVSGPTSGVQNREKLEMIYTKACDNVDKYY